MMGGYQMGIRFRFFLLATVFCPGYKVQTQTDEMPVPSDQLDILLEVKKATGRPAVGVYYPPVLGLLQEDCRNDPQRQFFKNVSFNVRATLGNAKNRFQYANEMVSNDSNIGVFGVEELCPPVATMVSASNKLMGTANCKIEVNDPEVRTLIQISPTTERKLSSLVGLLREMKFDRVSVIYGKKRDAKDDRPERKLITEVLLRGKINVISEHIIGRMSELRGDLPQVIARAIQETYLKTRCYVFLIDESLMFKPLYIRIMETMSRMGLPQTGQYLIIVYMNDQIFSLIKNWRLEFDYFKTFTDYSITDGWLKALLGGSGPVKQHYANNQGYIMESTRNMLLLSPAMPSGKSFTNFHDRLTSYGTKPKCPPICDPATQRLFKGFIRLDVLIVLGRFYDLMSLVTKVMSNLWEQGKDITNGLLMFESLINTEYTGVDGARAYIDRFGRGMKNRWVIAFRQPPNETGPALLKSGEVEYSLKDEYPRVKFDKDFQMNWIGGIAPINEPKCGYEGKLCPSLSNVLTIVVGAAMTGVIFLLLLIIAFVARRWQYEKSLMSMLWKVERRNLILKKARQLGSGSMHSIRSSMGTLGQSNGDMRKSHFSLRDWEQAMIREAKREEAKKKAKANPKKKRAFSDPEEEKWLSLPDYSMALHNGQLIGLKKIYKTHVDLTRSTRKELKELMDLTHDNLNPFIGAVLEPPHVFLCSEICLRGSLKDTLENDEIKLDEVFINSIVFDIIRGLSYLHKGGIKAHGRLKSSNCLIDSRWVVRLSSFGLHEFRQGEQGSEEDEVDEGKELLWTAPEILRNISGGLNSLEMQKGDIYAFGIILYEIFGRQGPYGEELLEPREIVDLVKFNKSGNPTRPDLTIVQDAPGFVKTMMQSCWSEHPGERPTIQKVQLGLKPLQKGLKNNIMDNMIALMERYTNNLEEVVSERTQQLDDERKKSERLLLMMLPQTVAETLKKGQLVEAEFYEHVSIYFSDIVGFTSMSSASTPLQVVNFLNELYTAFDTVISHYDVYKVETIGDAYMVVSGLPDRNGLNHAGEIASMSLQLLECVKRFKIRHRPDDMLKLRIGIHSGSVVAGVVGLRMPRYCLFGDTVNTASRMESNGEALKIHCSGECCSILEELGGYETAERGYVAMKGKGEQLTYWVLSENAGSRVDRLRSDLGKYPHLQRVLNF